MKALGVADAVAQLRSPDAPERFSPATGAPLLVVDAGFEGGAVGAEALAAARTGLAWDAPLLRLPAGHCSSPALPASKRREGCIQWGRRE